ncbi:6887_t:CDS:2, partial [Gigaspora rosea]
MPSNPINRLNCDFVASTTSTAKCTQCIKRNRECIFSEGKKRGPRPKGQRNHRRMKSKNNMIHKRHIDQPNHELICDLPQETIRVLSEMYPIERLPQ